MGPKPCVECGRIITAKGRNNPKGKGYICEPCFKQKYQQDLIQRAITFWQDSSPLVRWVAIPAATLTVIMILKTITGWIAG